MIHSRPAQRLGTALAIGIATSVLAAGAALAHPASEGAHPSGCIVTVEPGSVAVGGQFTVAGNFGGASIFLVKGANATLPAGATPNATTPAGTSFSVTFTAQAADVGDLTVFGQIPASGCGDVDRLTVTAALPNVAMAQPSAIEFIGWLAFFLALVLALRRLAILRR
ncbi:MAG: hypothetical protein M3R49_06870 [Chloroflexota bacterium]|nr:hypothetical protein [Chloroflexota bacterium]